MTTLEKVSSSHGRHRSLLKDILPRRVETTAIRAYVFVSSMSIRYKIAAALIVVLCLAITSLGVVSFSQQKRTLRSEMEKRAEAIARHIASAGKTGLLTDDELGIQATIGDVMDTPGIVYAMVLDSKGKVFAHNILREKGSRPDSPLDQAASAAAGLLIQTSSRGGEPILDAAIPIFSKLGSKTLRIGTARIGLSEAPLLLAIRTQKTSFFWVTSAFVLLGLLIAFALGNVLTRQIVVLVTAMRVVAGGDLNQMVEVQSRDDIGRLSQAFNDMILKLREKLHMERYLSQSTLQLIRRQRDKDKLSLGGERRQVTVLFSDIRGFTAMTETLAPEEIVGLLNVYLNLQAEVIYQRDGTVDKFVGDEVMAIFTEKDAERNAARAAVEIQRFVQSLNSARGQAGRRLMNVGIGLNSGSVIMGNMGSERQMDYTVIGDAVNTAARLCGAAASGQTVMSKGIREALGELCAAQALEPMKLKGKKDPVPVFALLEMKDAKRKHLRKPVCLAASYSLAGLSGEAHPGTVRDLSLGGYVIETASPVGAGSRIALTLSTPGLTNLREAVGVVRHLRKSGGHYLLGTAFEDLSAEASDQVSEWVHAVATEKAAAPELKYSQTLAK